MGRFNLNDYEMVEDRLKVFWAEYPEGRIETNVVHITDDGTCVTCLLYTSPSPRDLSTSRMPSSA